jgi:selenocysteine-specific elongation factor
MKSIIIGTAGHIDHGKTALVKALTGIDADRLEEEKRRGITIDLGFAHMELPMPGGETLQLGFVDVPGHERFVRNMLAGIGGIDLVLLVIAADEGIMPQTREHFDILQLLGVQRGIAVLTKSDMVDADTLDVVRLEVEDFFRGTFLDKPGSIINVSSLTGAGIADLKRAVKAVADAPSRDPRAIPRLPIDRVFTMKGFGTVVTGTLIAGTIGREDELEVFPVRKVVRVRGVQVHGQAANQAVAGQRTALNIANAAAEDLSRGMTLAPPATFEPTRKVDVKLRMLRSAPTALKNRMRVHFHSYTMENVAEVVLLEHDRQDVAAAQGQGKEADKKTKSLQLRPGQEAFVRLRLPEPALLLPGDRFIIRQFSPVITIGGGVVLDAAPMPRMSGQIDFLKVLADGDAQKVLGSRIARRGHNGITLSQLVAETGWRRTVIEDRLAGALERKQVVRIGKRFVDATAMFALQELIVKSVEDFQKKNPLSGGAAKEEVRERIGTTGEIFDHAQDQLLHQRKLELASDLLRLPGQGVQMKDEEAESKRQIEAAFATAGLQVPALHVVLAGLKIDRARAQKIVTLLLRDKVLIKVSDELVFHRRALEELRRGIASYKAKSTNIDVAAFKDLTGVTRKYAIPLLEYLDRERVTKRVGDVREIL